MCQTSDRFLTVAVRSHLAKATGSQLLPIIMITHFLLFVLLQMSPLVLKPEQVLAQIVSTTMLPIVIVAAAAAPSVTSSAATVVVHLALFLSACELNRISS